MKTQPTIIPEKDLPNYISQIDKDIRIIIWGKDDRNFLNVSKGETNCSIPLIDGGVDSRILRITVERVIESFRAQVTIETLSSLLKSTSETRDMFCRMYQQEKKAREELEAGTEKRASHNNVIKIR